jgi:hypothetical protein
MQKPKPFLAHLAENPAIYEAWKKYTFQVIDAGHQHFGPQSIGSRIRWESAISASSGLFKIDDRYNGYFARRFEHDFPEHAGFFRQRPGRFLDLLGPIV